MVDQRVIDYIKTNLLNGFPLEQIKQALINVEAIVLLMKIISQFLKKRIIKKLF